MNDLKKQKRWVVWMLEEVAGRNTKIPYTVRGKRASSTNPEDWSTYAQAKKAFGNFGSGIGIIFTPEENLLGIDIDHVIENGKITGEHSGSVTRIIEAARTYTELSPSGTGLHLYLAIDGKLTLTANRRSPFEAYTAGRFFTWSEQAFGKALPIRTVTPQEAETILSAIGYPWAKAEVAHTTTLGGKSTFSDEEITEAMFSSKNGEKIQALWNGDTSEYKGDNSRADAALLQHLAFWSRKDSEQMERLWLASPLGFREKTQKRKDYRKATIENAILSCREVYHSVIDETQGIDFLYTVSATGTKGYTANMENVARVLRAHPDYAGRFRFDAFAQQYQMRGTQGWQPFLDTDALMIQSKMSMLFPFLRRIGKDIIFDAMMMVARENEVDTAADFIKSIEWDKTDRLDSWLQKTYGTPDDEYHRKVGSNWIKGLVKRIIEPGCKFDYVLVLEGEQGVKKSTSLRVLGALPNGENWHVETTMGMDSKDFFMQFQRKAIIEFSEGETASRTEIKKMKAIITTQVDTFRPPYGRSSIDFPRHCVFCMTTNQDEYLKDETGNRRWLPVRVALPEADVEWLAANRDQLFAEAYVRLLKGETVYDFPKEETTAQQEMRRVTSPNEERIVEWYYADNFGPRNRSEGITIQEVYAGALNGVLTSMKKYEEMEIADVLKRVLKLTKKRKMVFGTQAVRWVNENNMVLDPDTLEVKVVAQSDSEFSDDDLPFGDKK